MRNTITRIWLSLWLALCGAAVAHAQATVAEIAAEEDDDQGFITRLLQEKLSDAGRQVSIQGFEGALSSRATFTRLTIADDDGTWITLENGAMQWTRSALFARRVQIQELSAERVILPRLPGAAEGELPQAEAPEFALPELPVGINIERISVGRVELGEDVMGVEATASVEGSMNLSGGEGGAQLTINRVDGPRGVFALDGEFSNETRVLRVGLDLDEDADGIFANLVGLEGRPAVAAQINGEGPLSEFAADLRLATDGQDRVTGRFALDNVQQGDEQGTAFQVDIGGDIAALVPPQHRDFFGASSRMRAEGWRGQSGRVEVPVLSINTDALDLSGSVATTDRGAPAGFDLQLLLGEDAGASTVPVRLPWADKPTTVRSGNLRLFHDAAQDSVWTLRGRVGDIRREEGSLTELRIDGRGHVEMDGSALELLRGWIAFGMDGIDAADPALAEAVGGFLNGGLNFHFRPGNALNLFGMNINGSDYRLTGDTFVSGLSSGITLAGDVAFQHRDLSRLSGLAGRDLSGSATVEVRGPYVLLSNAFDLQAEISGTDITIDQEHADRLLAGQSVIRVNARRDTTGIRLRELTVNARNLTAEASGYLNSNAADVQARISMPDLSVADPAMAGSVLTTAQLTGPRHGRRLQLDGRAENLVTGIAQLDGALAGTTLLTARAGEVDGSFELQEMTLENPQLQIEGEGRFAEGAIDATLGFDMGDLAVLDMGFSGGLNASARISESEAVRRIVVEGLGRDLSLGPQEGTLPGETRLTLQAEEQGGNLTIQNLDLANAEMNATAQGVIGETRTDLTGEVDIRSLAAFGRGWGGALRAEGSFSDDGQGGRLLDVTGTGQGLSFGQAQLDGALSSETRLTLRGTERDGLFQIDTAEVDSSSLQFQADGQLGGGQSDLRARLNAQDLRFLGQGFRGALNATGHLTEAEGTRNIAVQGNASGLAVGNPQADAVLAGQTSLDAAISLDGENRLAIQRVNLGNNQFSVTADGDPALLNLQARLADLALIVPGFGGPLEVQGTVGQGAEDFQVDVAVNAPGGLQSRVAGVMARDFSTTNLSINGGGDAAIVNPLLRTRSIQGPLSFDLTLNGPPGIGALGGRLALTNGRLAEPRLGLSVSAVNAVADFANGQAQVDIQGQVDAGGTISVSGPVSLTGGPLDLAARLSGVVLRDPNLYEILVDGEVGVSGNPADGPLVQGRINVQEAELRIPSTGFGGAASIPPIQHLYDRPPVRATRAKAGLSEYPGDAAALAGMAGPAAVPPANPARFDLTISAPQQVFVRGRGVDAELGGEIRLTGDARTPIPVGQLELIRGRVDLLGKRFDLTEGLIEMQGSLIPIIRLVAETVQDGITTRVIIDGEARDPDITFESSPDMPEEEVLSHLLFGRGLDTITPLQAAQLANAIAVLAGRGGEGIVSRLRSATGLDDLDLATDSDGNVSVRAGKYLSDNLYTDVQVGADGTTRLNLNLDVSRSVTVRGSVNSEGDNALGVYYERDY
ncbi:translocation/assembly module TamB domain-containing protein [uncultured Paracoccus sp.]|uniref:translocation/assembly module TamB domain-containing protein n=1 Tax=uncultured Paracoccus sp. TaxID=189685 RepID=UPI0025DD052D|nr:translocation/assembly module TamB domain-containing protein [uncultured Paracoccus sp.]